jgi:hypothetical protein
MEAELFGVGPEQIVLRREDGELGLIRIADLSEADREYLKSEEAQKVHEKNIGAIQKWTTTSGLELTGRIVDYVIRDVTIQQRRGQTYVRNCCQRSSSISTRSMSANRVRCKTGSATCAAARARFMSKAW